MANRYAVVSNVATSSLMWATTSGGAATISGIASSDTLIFDANTPAGTITFDLNEVSNGLEMLAGFTGTLDMSAVTYNVTGAYPAFKIQGGNINMPSSGLVFQCRGIENTIGGTINYGTGIFQANTAPSYNLLPANQTMYDFKPVGNGTHNILGSDIVVSNKFIYQHASSWTGGDVVVLGDVELNDVVSGASFGTTSRMVFRGSAVQNVSCSAAGSSMPLLFDKTGGSVNYTGVNTYILNSGVTVTAQHASNLVPINWGTTIVRLLFSPVMDMQGYSFAYLTWRGAGNMTGVGVVGVTEYYDSNATSSLVVEVHKSCNLDRNVGSFQFGVVRFVGSSSGNCKGGLTINNGSSGGIEFAKTGGITTFEGFLSIRNQFTDTSSGGAVLDLTTKKSTIITKFNPVSWDTLFRDFWNLIFDHQGSCIMGAVKVRNNLEIKPIGGSLNAGDIKVEGNIILSSFAGVSYNLMRFTMTGSNNQSLSTQFTSNYPNSLFKIDKRRGSVKLLTNVDINAPGGTSESIEITTDSVVDLNGFNLNCPGNIKHDGQVDNTNGGTLTSGMSITRGISSVLGNLRTYRVSKTFDRLASKTRFRTRKQIERVV